LAGVISPGYPAAGWVTIGSTRQATANSLRSYLASAIGGA